MVIVMGHEGVLMKGPNRDMLTVDQIWQFSLKIGLSASKWLILALAAHHHYEFDTKHCIFDNSIAITDEILAMSRLPKWSDENKILSGMSWS
jgi:hypothetical protein